MEIPKQKTTIYEIKQLLYGLSSIMDMIKKKANECENRSIGIIHSEKQK
jgi:hypothetical protein